MWENNNDASTIIKQQQKISATTA